MDEDDHKLRRILPASTAEQFIQLRGRVRQLELNSKLQLIFVGSLLMVQILVTWAVVWSR